MVKAFDRMDNSIATVRWIGEVYGVSKESFTGVLVEDYVNGEERAVVEVPLANIADSERPRVVKGALFYCDVELTDDVTVKNIRGIEFDDGLAQSSHEQAAGLLFGVIAKDQERWNA